MLRAASFIAALVLAPASFAQQFTYNTTDIPGGNVGFTESVEFGDVDRDGDWDVVFADGGDIGNQQSRIWINAGHSQGGTTGVFVNETAARFPAIAGQSRDLEFADFDGDADLDLHLTNESQIMNQPCRFWINQGLAQGGSIGFYVDETAARWVGLGGPGSSMPPSQVLPGGGFVDWSGETAFADFDNDGHIDLVHTSHGGAYSGNVPTRIFLNDGQGFFSEFNPSGFQLSGGSISNGQPGLWCLGTQLSNTLIYDGTRCDIATTCAGVDLGDIDGDFDVDIILGSIQDFPRAFVNRLDATAGILDYFRDATGSAFPPSGPTTGNGHYGQEIGDLDQDGDLDIFGVNWLSTGFAFNDSVHLNGGDGVSAAPITVPSSQSDDEDGDLIDYDLDGDLDLVVANFSGQERVNRNDGGTSFPLATGVLPTDTTTTRDVSIADVDEDGDYDIFCANDSNQPETYLQNGALANDVTPPRVESVEQAPDRVAGPLPTVVRTLVGGNSPLSMIRHDVVQLEVTVDNGPLIVFAMRTSGGQLFRGEIDGTLVGTIRYRVRATDEHGNTVLSSERLYIGTSSGTLYCFGDGTGTACPCGNNSPASSNAGCMNSLGLAGALRASGTASVAADSLALRATAIPNASVLFFQGDTRVAGGAGTVFGDGLRCAGGTIVRLGQKVGAGNQASYPAPGDISISVRGSIPVTGGTRDYQAWYRNAATFCTSATFNLTNGVEISWSP